MEIKLGIIREGKFPPDKRVALSPKQCLQVEKLYPNVKVKVQRSAIRAFKDEEYAQLGLPLVDDLSDCDIIIGVKEVNIEDLIPKKHFFFFSHTYKLQPYNRKLLQAILAKKIQLTDYEMLTDENNNRIIGFGRYAGIVGCYNAFRTYGIKHRLYDLKPAHLCCDRKEMEGELVKVKLPKTAKIVLTGWGRVGHGAREIIGQIPITEVQSDDFINQNYDFPVFTQLSSENYVARSDGKPYDSTAFYADGAGHVSIFSRYLKTADIYIACHYWKEGSPFLFTRDDLKESDIRTSVVADVSCDIDGPVASTIRPSTIANPIYGYHPIQEKEIDFMDKDAIAVMAVDNLPCELPLDASIDFGNELIDKIFPALFGDDPTQIIARGSETTKEGMLSPSFTYLKTYVEEK